MNVVLSIYAVVALIAWPCMTAYGIMVDRDSEGDALLTALLFSLLWPLIVPAFIARESVIYLAKTIIKLIK